jgi:alanine racemase
MNGMPPTALSWVEVSRAALRHNIRQFRDVIGPRRGFMAVVKANAYGHVIGEVARIALENGVDWLGVNSLEEGLALRRGGIEAPLLVLGYVPLEGLDDAVAAGLRFIVYNPETVERAAAAVRKTKREARLHIKLETGTHRQGVAENRLVPFARRILKHPGLVLEGLTSHFANIEDTTNFEYPRRQLDAFKEAVGRLRAAGISVPYKHMSCTAAAMLFPETYFNLVRVGIGLYGLWPSKETFLSCKLRKRRPLALKPALAWKARIAQVKVIPKGAFVGYGGTYRTTRRTLLAVIPVGYYDGYGRSLSNASHVLIRGRRAAVVGRVAMDFLTADVTDIPGVRLEDEAVLIGKSGPEHITAGALAALAGTIAYEIVARINPEIPRIVV